MAIAFEHVGSSRTCQRALSIVGLASKKKLLMIDDQYDAMAVHHCVIVA